MITIFRKLRKSFLNESKFGQYFVYAIGEIILVMIGILLALQVNNWNEKRKTEKTEQSLLQAIHQETKNNLVALEAANLRLINSLENQRKIVSYIDVDTSKIVEKELSKILNKGLSQEIVFNYQSGVLNELINSGGLKLISNDSIQSILASFDQEVRNVKDQEEELLLGRNNVVDYLLKHGDMRRMLDDEGVSEGLNQSQLAKKNNSNKALLLDQVFENYLVLYLTLGAVLEKYQYPTIKKKLEALLQMIEKELA